MTLHIPLSQESETRLREFAAAHGRDVASVVADAIEEKLGTSEDLEGKDKPPMTADEWIAELREWAASHQRLNYVADDSRESIYAGRGE